MQEILNNKTFNNNKITKKVIDCMNNLRSKLSKQMSDFLFEGIFSLTE